MKAICITVFLFFSLFLLAQTPVHPPATGGWVSVFSDEFNAAKLDRNVWKAEHNSFNNSGNTKRDSSNFALVDGDLRIYIRKGEDPTYPKQKWTCGYIYTKETFGRNVYFEARMKTQKVSGVNNAFWLVTRDDMSTSYSNRYEIDINEIQYDVVKQKNAAHLAWHDWKTYQYATDAEGNPVDNALGYMEYYDSDDYQVWGFWLKDNEFHFYLNGRKIWNGISHHTHTQQWQTGIGKIFPWAKQEEQRAYGKYKQLDWNYLGGYTGEMMHVAFSNMIMALDWTPETDDADGTFMSVDWVRVYEPESVHNELPSQQFTQQSAKEVTGNVVCSDNEISIGKGKIKIPLTTPFSFAETHKLYFSYHVNNPDNKDYKVSLLDASNQKIGELSANEKANMSMILSGNETKSATVYPYAFYSGGKHMSTDYFVVNRLTANMGLGQFDADTWSVKLIDEGEEVPRIEPFYYPNIDETGETSFNNKWSLNAKKMLSETVSAIEIENFSEEVLKISDLRFGNNYLSVIADEVNRPFASISTSSVRSAAQPDTVYITVKSTGALHRISLQENESIRYLDNVLTGVYKLPVSPATTTVYKLISIESDTKTGYVSDKTATVFVQSTDYVVKYPFFDTYIQENLPENDFSSSADFYLKNDRQYIREAFFEYDISDLKSEVENAGLFFYLRSISPAESVSIGIFALTDAFSQPLYWAKRPSWVKKQQIGAFDITSNTTKYYGDDISEYINECIRQGKTKIYFQLAVINGSNNTLARFVQYASNRLTTSPKLLVLPKNIENPQILKSELSPSFDTFVAQQSTGSGAGSGNRENYFWLKNPKAVGWGREAFIRFDLTADVIENLSSARLRMTLNSLTSADRYTFISISGLPSNPDITNLTWSEAELFDSNEIGISAVDTTDVGKYIYWDVKDYLQSQVEQGNTAITLKLNAVGGSIDALLKFDQGHNNTIVSANPPILEIAKMTGNEVGIVSEKESLQLDVYPNPAKDFIIVEGADISRIEIYSVSGMLMKSQAYNLSQSKIDISALPAGVYFLVAIKNDNAKCAVKILKSE